MVNSLASPGSSWSQTREIPLFPIIRGEIVADYVSALRHGCRPWYYGSGTVVFVPPVRWHLIRVARAVSQLRAHIHSRVPEWPAVPSNRACVVTHGSSKLFGLNEKAFIILIDV